MGFLDFRKAGRGNYTGIYAGACAVFVVEILVRPY